MKIFDYLAVASLAFMSYGILTQWWQIKKSNSVKNISGQEVAIRFLVTLILLVKILLVGDAYLIVGQVLLSLAVAIYFITLIKIKFFKKS